MQGVTGVQPDLITNLTIFAIGIILAQLVKYLIVAGLPLEKEGIGVITLLGVIMILILFTFFPLEIPLFQDPGTGVYGIP
jgi:hypothetical protein